MSASSRHCSVRLYKDLVLIDETFSSTNLFHLKRRPNVDTATAMADMDITHPIFVYRPQQAPYVGGEFEVEFDIPIDYPLAKPKVKFRTPIYSPVIEESGALCLPLLTKWLPNTRLHEILSEIDYFINHLDDVDEPIRPQLLNEYRNDRENFMRNAEQKTKEKAQPQKH
ncbi:unnamed protein product [Didymodactylos carnosus]|uniref:UBC core domain-containing protein n=1 Tax=Didymodactylos carnosus TaxID=1234261 RepID=A0A813TU02_9BILA|nr:unnamed protein product [Didymodactylos carnosus]CAF1579297.1 unnamed protein product [Didymodactylos carnosus]CAF3602314.1 unnamed protein product [Didymodactylos carnosus]CAF4378013.1 unnamed protein product [Didymodactylos carnosus]